MTHCVTRLPGVMLYFSFYIVGLGLESYENGRLFCVCFVNYTLPCDLVVFFSFFIVAKNSDQRNDQRFPNSSVEKCFKSCWQHQ